MDDASKLDLNLLQVFDALMQDGNLTRAGYRLGLSQPAMSHSLGKLRKIVGDALFVRVPTGMEPTQFAIRMAPAVRDGLQLLRKAVQGEGAFDPATCDRTFNVLMSDIGELVYVPRLIGHLGTIAPKVDIRVLQMAREAYAEAFFSGEADIALGFLPGLKGGFYQQRLFSDSYVCVVRKRHPRIRTLLSLDQFVAESHVLVEPGGSPYRAASQQTSTTTLIERYLAERNLSRRIALRVPHFTVVPDIVQSTDLIATVPSYVIKGQHYPELKMVKLPFTVPRFEVKQYWHQRNQDDAANRWLRGVLAELFTQT